MNSAFTMDDMIAAKNKIFEHRRDQVMDIVNFFSVNNNIKREDIDLDTKVFVSSILAEEYEYLKDISFVKVIPFLERDMILIGNSPCKEFKL